VCFILVFLLWNNNGKIIALIRVLEQAFFQVKEAKSRPVLRRAGIMGGGINPFSGVRLPRSGCEPASGSTGDRLGPCLYSDGNCRVIFLRDEVPSVSCGLSSKISVATI
jgi:hypothetical protein